MFADVLLEPSTNCTCYKMLFSVLKNNVGINYHLKDFLYPGGFANWWADAFCRVKDVRPDEVYERIMNCVDEFNISAFTSCKKIFLPWRIQCACYEYSGRS